MRAEQVNEIIESYFKGFIEDIYYHIILSKLRNKASLQCIEFLYKKALKDLVKVDSNVIEDHSSKTSQDKSINTINLLNYVGKRSMSLMNVFLIHLMDHIFDLSASSIPKLFAKLLHSNLPKDFEEQANKKYLGAEELKLIISFALDGKDRWDIKRVALLEATHKRIDEELVQFCEVGNIPMVKLLQSCGADLNCSYNKDGQSPLVIAFSKANLELAKFLLEYNATPNISNDDNDTLLHSLCHNGDALGVKLLLKYKVEVSIQNNNRNTPLHMACSINNKEIIELLLTQITSEDINILGSSDLTALHYSCQNLVEKEVDYQDTIEIINSLLKQKADLNLKDFWCATPIHLILQNTSFNSTVLQQSSLDLIERCIKSNVDYDIKDLNDKTPLQYFQEREIPNKAEVFGQLLITALTNKKFDLAEWFINKGADLDTTDYSANSPLHLIYEEKDLNIARLLITKGTKIDSKNILSRTPLHLACEVGNIRLVKFLLQSKADPEQYDILNKTPRQLVNDYKNPKIGLLFLYHTNNIEYLDLNK